MKRIFQRFLTKPPSSLFSLPAFLTIVMLCGWSARAQESIGGTAAVTQNFDAIGITTTAPLPTGFKIGSDWSSGTAATTRAAGTTGTGAVTSSSGGGIYNFANGITATSSERALGFLTSSGFASPQSIVYAFTNNTGSTITALNLSWNYEKYRSGSRAFGWTFFHGSASTATIAATDGDQAYAADAGNTTIYNPPSATAKAVSLTGLNISNGATYYLRWTFTGVGGSTNGQAIGLDDFSITATTGASIPAITPSVTALTAFTVFEGSPSEPQTFTVSGTDLTGDISISAPTGFEIATDGATYGPTASLATTSGSASGTVSVRISGTAAVGTPSGNIALSSAGAATANVSVTGTVLATGTPILGSEGALVPFTTFAGSVSAVQVFYAFGSNLTGDITVTAPAGFEVANEDENFGPTANLAELAGSAGGNILVRIAASAPAGPLTGDVTVSSPGASDIFVATSGTVTQPTLAVSLAPASVAETAGGAASTGTVTVNPAPAADLSVALSSGNVSTATVPESVTILAGQTTGTFPVTAVANPGSFASGQSVITASAPGHTSGTATLTVLNVDAAPVTRISLSSSSESYTQNFDGLGATNVPAAISSVTGVPANIGAITSSTMDGWYGAKLSGSGTTSTPLTADAGSGSSGLVYSYGATSAPDRAFGVLASGSNVMAIGALIKNDTGATLSGLKFSFTAEFWRSSTTTQNILTFAYGKVDGVEITEGNFLAVATGASVFAGLDVTGPVAVSANGPLDGNSSGNQATITDVILPISLAPGEVVFIRWQDANDSGNDAGLAIDNLTITAIEDLSPPSISGSLTLSGTVGVAITPYQITASGSPVSYGSGTLPAGLSLDSDTGIISGTPTAAQAATDVQISATNAGGTGSASLTITIAKGTPTIQSAPTASGIVEGGALSASVLSGGSASVPGSFAWTSPATVPPIGTAGYSVTFTPTDAANYDTATLTVDVTVASADYLFSDWSGGAEMSSELLTKFAVGGAPSPTAVGEAPVLAVEGGSLTLTAIVRTNNSKLTVVGEAVAELTGTWSTSGVTSTAVGVSQTGVPEGCERQKFSVEIGAGSKKFLRLRSTLAP